MITKTKKITRGFTLIELIIYLALFSILMGGVIASVFSIVETTNRNQAKALFQEEGDFLVGKINWALSSIQYVITPPTGNSQNTLMVTKWDSSIGTLTITEESGTMTLKRGSHTPQTLNNDNVQVSNLTFTHAYNGGTNPESVTATFTLTTKTINGAVLSRNFSTTNYIRK